MALWPNLKLSILKAICFHVRVENINLLKHSSVLFIERNFSFVSFFQHEHSAPVGQPDLHPPQLLCTMQFPEKLMLMWHLNINQCTWCIIWLDGTINNGHVIDTSWYHHDTIILCIGKAKVLGTKTAALLTTPYSKLPGTAKWPTTHCKCRYHPC